MATQKEKDSVEQIKAFMIRCGASEDAIVLLTPTIENVAYMQKKLDAARKAIKKEDVVVPYDNGGGQTGIRENPRFKGYESLFKSYMAGIKLIMDALPKQPTEAMVDDVIEQPKTILEIVKARKEA